MPVAALVALVYSEHSLLEFEKGIMPAVSFNISPETNMHVYTQLLPYIVHHGVYHSKSGLAKLFKGEVFVLDYAGLVMSICGGDE